MSEITTVIVLAAGNKATMRRLTDPATELPWAGLTRFVNLASRDAAQFWIAPKQPEGELFAATFNHLDRRPLLAALEELPWFAPEFVQVLIRWQHDEVFGLWMFRDNRLCEIQIPGIRRVSESALEGQPYNPGRLEVETSDRA